MIESLTNLILGCYLQVSIVATAGVALTSLCLRYRPFAARTLAYATILLVIGIIATSPIRVPNFVSNIDSAAGQQTLSEPAASKIEGALPTSSDAIAPDMASNQSVNFVGIELSKSLVSAAKKLIVQKKQTNPWLASSLKFLAMMIVVGSVFGVARFAFAWYSTKRIIRLSNSIMDEEVHAMVAELCREFGLTETIRLVQSEDVLSASVIGWKTSYVVLPSDWNNWQATQLRAVLAHELAHVSANDFAWRSLSCFVANVNLCNPFVSMLLRRVMLCQEMIADSLAGKLVGPKGYVRTLSGFALENDTTQLSVSTGIAPVFSGDLIRRIKMMRRMDFSKCGQKTPLLQTAGIAVLALIGAATFAARGIAQDTVRGESEAADIRVAKLPAHAGKTKLDPTRMMFQRQPVDLKRHMPYKDGFFCIRLAEFFEVTDPQEVGYLAMLNDLMSQELKNYLSPEKPIKLDFGMVNRVEGSATMSARLIRPRPKSHPHKKGEAKDGDTEPSETSNDKYTSRLAIGFSKLQLHFDRKVDSLGWAKRYGKPNDIITKGGFSVWSLPILPALGPFPMGMANLDEQTICISNAMIRDLSADDTQPTLDAVVEQVTHKPTVNDAEWVPMYHRMAGGLMTFVYTNREIRTKKGETVDAEQLADELELKLGECFDHLLHSFQTYAIGVDLTNDARRMGLRFRIGYDTKDQATEAFEKIQEVISVARKTLNDRPAEKPGDAVEAAVQEFFLGLVNDGFIQVQENADDSADVFIAGTIDLPSPMGVLIKAMLTEAVKLAEKPETNSEKR